MHIYIFIFFLRKKEKKVKSLSCVQLFVTPWTVAYQGAPSMGFSRQEYWSGLHFLQGEDIFYYRLYHLFKQTSLQ